VLAASRRLLSHVSYLNLGSTWDNSVSQNNWRQQLCLQRDFYNVDVTGQQVELYPGLEQSWLSSETISAGADSLFISSWKAWVSNGQIVAALGELLEQKGNQLTSVRDICANRDANLVLLVVGLIFGGCCLVLLAGYACVRMYKKKYGLKLSSGGSCPSTTWAALSVSFEAVQGLGGLAFYYYDLVTSVIVLVQVWGMWPGDILVAIFFFHFATTGAIVAFHGCYRLAATRYDCSEAGLRMFACIMMLSISSSPFMIPLVIVLDTCAFIRQVFKVIKYVVRLPGMKWLSPGYRVALRLNHCITAADFLGLRWVDLENYENMHNLVAAVFQSLPTVILNSVLFSLGNKPSHGIFFSSKLFVAAIVASCLAMLKCLIVILWQSLQGETGATKYVLSLVVGKTLAGKEAKSSAHPSRIDMLVQQYQRSGSAPLGAPG